MRAMGLFCLPVLFPALVQAAAEVQELPLQHNTADEVTQEILWRTAEMDLSQVESGDKLGWAYQVAPNMEEGSNPPLQISLLSAAAQSALGARYQTCSLAELFPEAASADDLADLAMNAGFAERMQKNRLARDSYDWVLVLGFSREPDAIRVERTLVPLRSDRNVVILVPLRFVGETGETVQVLFPDYPDPPASELRTTPWGYLGAAGAGLALLGGGMAVSSLAWTEFKNEEYEYQEGSPAARSVRLRYWGGVGAALGGGVLSTWAGVRILQNLEHGSWTLDPRGLRWSVRW